VPVNDATELRAQRYRGDPAGSRPADLFGYESIGAGFKSNYYDIETGEEFWISGPRKDGADRLYGEPAAVEIDDDVREEYWTEIRGRPSCAAETVANR
jgi:hypothetical protein